MIETEKTASTAVALTTVKSVTSTDINAENKRKELNRQMNELITIIKEQHVQSSKEQNKSGGKSYGRQDKLITSGKGGRNLRKPDINSLGPFREKAAPIQCYNCGGWGHRAFECMSPLNFKRG